jgi:hypothetical protein
MKPPAPPSEAEILEIALTMKGDAASRFLPMLGEGIFIGGPGGRSVDAFLLETAGIPPTYLKERVQTVFLDGRPLDDFAAARVTDGATLALSAAMPGLAGAVLRRGGFYAPMRRQISHEARPADGAPGDVLVTLKLFNMIARELGPALLEKGVLVPGDRLQDALRRQGRWAWEGCLSARAGGRDATPAEIVAGLAGRRWVRLSVRSAG